ncbi:MAG: DNA mismatch repair endonuclease MutL [Dehalococcoidia bacterium]
MSISILPAEVASRIAAGEVVERPASIVKELVENALDAGATRVSIEIAEGGISLIRVTDNGHGIDPEELSLAFARHATSKLRHEQEMEAIATLGFRGEALPSIAAVADVEAISRTAAEPTAGRIRLRFGELTEQGARGAPTGTTISVRSLFQQQPARLKFLRTPAAESGAIAGVVSHFALAYPEVAFSLKIDGRETFVTSGQGNRREAASGVYGAETAAAMLEVTEDDEGHSLAALIAPPSISRSTRGYITIFINRRLVKSRSLSFAVEEAYANLIQVRRFPIAIVDLRLPPAEIDVNVHPAKAEVRLRNERQVFSLVQRPLRRALSGMSPIGSSAPTGWPSALPPQPSPPTYLTTRYGEPAADEPPLYVPLHASVVLTRTPEAKPALLEPEQKPLPAAVPILRPLGQAGTTYIIAEGPAGLYLIDQHAAHERVLFEQYAARLAASTPALQPLLTPIPLELTPEQQAMITVYAPALRDHGFEIEPFGPGAYLLRTAPSGLRREEPSRAFRELLDLMCRDDAPSDPRNRVAASLACHAAVRAGQTLSLDEMRDLLQQLEACDSPQTCPHGRPTMLHLSADELAKRFSRK